MSTVLKNSLAAWHQQHGFGILCIISPNGEQFLVAPSEARREVDRGASGVGSWSSLSEAQLRQHLRERDFSDSDAEAAIQLARDWATTISGSWTFPSPS